MGNSSSSISHRPGLHPTTHIRPHYTTPHRNTLHRIWRGHSSFALGVDTTRGTTVTGYRLPLDWRRAQRQGSFSLDSYRPPQAGQPPASKVLSRHGLPSSLGAWRLGDIRQADRNSRTRQQQENPKETSPKTGLLECPHYADRSL